MSPVLAFVPQAAPRQTSLPQRNALRLLHTSALIRGPNGNWYARTFPAQPVWDNTVRALAQRGLVRIESYQGMYELRECAVLTPAGEAERCGVRLTTERPPPVALDAVMRDVEAQIKRLDAEIAASRSATMRESEAARDARRRLAELEAFIARCETRIAGIETERENTIRRRTELGAIVAHAVERVSETLQGDGR
jgi:hypothetical protein